MQLEIQEGPNRIAVLDWTTRKEWNIRVGRVRNSKVKGRDFRKSNLHVMNYSISSEINLPVCGFHRTRHSEIVNSRSITPSADNLRPLR